MSSEISSTLLTLQESLLQPPGCKEPALCKYPSGQEINTARELEFDELFFFDGLKPLSMS